MHLVSDNVAFHLIQQIRDAVHRFAITAHRTQYARRRIESSLQDIEGVGPKRRWELLKYFGGLQELQKASVEELPEYPALMKNWQN